MKTLNPSQIEPELKNSIELLLKPIIHATETKHSKLFVSSLSIVKKLVTYNMIKQNHTGVVIQILKDILDNSSEEFIQIKVLETLLPMVNPQTIHLTETLVNNVLIMCLKVFSLKNQNFKNPVSALFKQLMITIFGFLDSFLRPIIEKKIKQKKDKLANKEVVSSSVNLPQIQESVFKEIPKEEINDDIQKENNENLEQENNLNKQNNNQDQEGQEEENKNNDYENNQTEEKYESAKNSIVPDIPNNHLPQKEEVENNESDEIDLSDYSSFEICQTSLAMFKNLILIADGKKKDWIASSIYSKCLGLELLAGVVCQTGFVLKYLPEYIDVIKNDLQKIIKKNFEITNDYIMGLKLSRISIQLVENLHICYDLIPYLLKYAENQALTWQKLIGLECLSSLCSNNLVLKDLYEKKLALNEAERINIYDDVINSLTKISYSVVTNKTQDTLKKKEEKKVETTNKQMKIIEMHSILTETDINIPTISTVHIFKLVTECYTNLKDSFVIILETNNLKLGRINRDYNKEQLLCKDMLNYNYEQIKNAMTALLLNSTEEAITQTYLVLFQCFINIYGSITLPIARDSYLNDLCKLAIPNNLENSLEMKEKNLLIAKTLLNIVHCVNILDYNSWMLLLETMQKIYLMLINSNNHMFKPSEEFEIDVIIRNLENNIKKYNPDYGVNEERSVLKPQNNMEEVKEINEEKSHEKQDVPITQDEPQASTFRGEVTNFSTQVSNQEKKKGIFSGIKSAFGFSKTQKIDPNMIKKVPHAEESIDLQILSTAIDTLFINSIKYEDSTIKDITRALLDSSHSLVEASTTINDSINTYIHFNLTKLLDLSVINVKRIHTFWDILVNTVNFITSKNLTNISRFALDVLTIIDLFILTQYKPSSSEESEWDYDNWQNTLFMPYKLIAGRFISRDINLNIIYNLSKVLQNCGQYLNATGWTNYIEICDILISKSDEMICDNTFKLIEQIINEYLDYLTPFNIVPLINILETFSLYKKNNNISYSAITMYWSAANIAESFQKIIKMENDIMLTSPTYTNFNIYQKEFYSRFCKTPEEREAFFNKLWEEFFLKTVTLCQDFRPDVRKSAINIFADIYVAKNNMISNETSLIIINKYFLEILEKSYTQFETRLKLNRTKKNVTNDNSNPSLKTPKFSDNVGEIKIGDFKIDQLKLPEKKQKFDEESINKLSASSGEEKEWEDTTILVIQALGKVLKSFLTLNLTIIKDHTYYKENMLNNLIGKYTKIMRMTTPEIASTILKSLQEIYFANANLFLAFFEAIWIIYEEMGWFITTDFFLSQLCTMATSTKMVYNVLEILKEIFLNESNVKIKPDLLKGRNLENLLQFIKMLVKSAKNCEGIQSITNPQRLLGDEKQIFEFAEKISKMLKENNSWEIYCKFLSNYLKLDLTDHHTEAHCRKALELFENFFSSKEVDLNFVRDYLPKLIIEIKELSCIRNKNDQVSILMKNNKSIMHLWHFAAFELIKILSAILCTNSKKKEEEYVNSTNNSFNNNYGTSTMLIDIEEEPRQQQDVDLNVIWEASISCFETIFRQSEGGYKNIARNYLEELMKSCQDMEIQIINFIVNGLLPNSLKIPKEMQIKLLTLLDMGSNFDYNVFNLNSQSLSQSSSISRVRISNLFELCKYRSEESLRKGII